jgi:lipopolysaccharide/colanic/teichoic acid biosynthesis glycosyltransferase
LNHSGQSLNATQSVLQRNAVVSQLSSVINMRTMSPVSVAAPVGVDHRNSRYRAVEFRLAMMLKRLADYFVGGLILAVALPVMAIVAVLIAVISPGPVLFVQQRVGWQGRTIHLMKFRTMYVDAEARLQDYLAENPDRKAEWERYCNLENDPRVIPYIGNFLRKTSLDELPNLINVLRAEISLVGPRPLPLYHQDLLDEEFQTLRQTVLPGITGLWQVNRGDLRHLSRWDAFYVKNWSLLLDLKILWRTIAVVVVAHKPGY